MTFKTKLLVKVKLATASALLGQAARICQDNDAQVTAAAILSAGVIVDVVEHTLAS